MRKETKLYLGKACDSLLLTTELFNRPQELGRVAATLVLLDHSFEMLLKAAILHKGGKIRTPKEKNNLGFDACVRKALSDEKICFLSNEQALTLQAINGLRDAAQHDLLAISEAQHYLHTQSGVTLFGDILKNVFQKNILEILPSRFLPISARLPKNIEALFKEEVDEISKMLQPQRRQVTEALSRLKPLVILDSAMRGEKSFPTDNELVKIGKRLNKEKDWQSVFPGVRQIKFTTDGEGVDIALRFSKKDGVPIICRSSATIGDFGPFG